MPPIHIRRRTTVDQVQNLILKKIPILEFFILKIGVKKKTIKNIAIEITPRDLLEIERRTA